MAPTVVLLSSYNGNRFILQQIESIRNQTVTDWKLFVRDDGSTDSTRSLVASVAAGDSRVTLLDDQRNVGPWRSFGILLNKAAEDGAQTVFLCDQDDVWLPEKMERQISRLAALPSNTPALVHSDLVVVGETLAPIHKSWHRYQRMSYAEHDPLRTLLIHNAVVGCTIAINRPLLDYALPVPAGVYHDWWLAVCAAAFGKVEMISEPLVLYRQHSANVVGAAPRHRFLRKLLSSPVHFVRSSFDEFAIGVDQALELRDRTALHKADADRIVQYSRAFTHGNSMIRRIASYRRSRAKPQRLVSRALMYGIVAAYPAMRAGSGSSGLGETDGL